MDIGTEMLHVPKMLFKVFLVVLITLQGQEKKKRNNSNNNNNTGTKWRKSLGQ